MRRTGVLGGTFDPIHLGHLAVAAGAQRRLGLDEVLLLPLRVGPHRAAPPVASPFHRFAMTALAALAAPGAVRACDLELSRPGTSYTAETLRALHAAGWAPGELFFLTGADAFAEIGTWREYPALLDLAHFVACARPGWSVASLPSRLPDLAARMTEVPAAVPPAAGGADAACRVFLVDCPTPDVSSTTVRARARAGLPIADLVPPEVAHYIRRHGLYGAGEAGEESAASNLHD
jgi:nicotinate-nucleotide adenylyltransferase